MKMAFEQLSESIQSSLKKLGKKGKVTEQDVRDALKEVRLALLEADVNYLIVKAFMKTITEKAEGEAVWQSLTPEQQVIKIVRDELQKLMGDETVALNESAVSATTIMMVGLQGSGKTTLTAKLAHLLKKKENAKPFLIAADIYRPAAIDQLKTLAAHVEVPLFELGTKIQPQEIVEKGLIAAKEYGATHILIDTAGRLHIDEKLMAELKDIKALAQPNEIMLVIDAMTGQDAVNVTLNFHDALGVTGATLTKLDGDARGGAALSIRSLTSVPIKFVGVSEKIDGLEVFHPDRMADRILGMGDVISLIEKAQDEISEEDALRSAERMFAADYNLEDFFDQMQQMKKVGSIESIMGMLPGMDKSMMQKAQGQINDKTMQKKAALIQSMTKKERLKPSLLNASRKRRIAMGAGQQVTELNRLLNEFEQSKQMMRQMAKMMQGGNNPFAGGMPDMGSLMQSLGGGRSNKRAKGKGKGKGMRRFPF